jgi:hypothetical protein
VRCELVNVMGISLDQTNLTGSSGRPGQFFQSLQFSWGEQLDLHDTRREPSLELSLNLVEFAASAKSTLFHPRSIQSMANAALQL